MSESLQEYLVRKREINKQKRARRMVIPVAGYEDRFAGQYKILTFEERRAIQQNHDEIGEQDDGMELVNASADFIIAANEDLLEITSPGTNGDGPSYRSLGKRWMAPTIGELFGIPVTAPNGQVIPARDALKLVMESDEIMDHFGAITREGDLILAEVEDETQGEAEPSQEG
jgi:hypothetical protein